MSGRRISLAGALLALASAACSNPGEVVVVIQTDMAVPKDIDAIRLQVESGKTVHFDTMFPSADGDLMLPGTLGVVGRDEDDDVTFRATGFLRGEPRVTQQAIRKIADDSLVMLRLHLSWLCADEPACGDPRRTCKLGACESADVDPEGPLAYAPADIFGGGSGDGSDGICFDVTSCFQGTQDVTVESLGCSVKAEPGANIALRTEGDGVCGPFGCFIPLDELDYVGLSQFRLPSAVCERMEEGRTEGRVLGVAVSTSCAQKTEGTPICGPWTLTVAPKEPDSPEPITLAAGQRHPMAIAADGANIYWTNAGKAAGVGADADGEVKRAPLGGGSPFVLAVGEAAPSGLVVHDAGDGAGPHVYWINDGTHTIRKARADGGSSIIESRVTYEGTRSSIAALGTALHWTTSTGLVLTLPTTGGQTPTVLATGQQDPIAVTVAGGSVFWIDRGSGVGSGVLRRNGPGSPVAEGQGLPIGLAVDSTHVYWTDAEAPGGGEASGTVKRVSQKSGLSGDVEEPEVLAAGQAFPFAITLDKTFVYWTNRGNGKVMRVPKGGGGARELASGQRNPVAIVADGVNVYWANAGTAAKQYADGAIMKLETAQ